MPPVDKQPAASSSKARTASNPYPDPNAASTNGRPLTKKEAARLVQNDGRRHLSCENCRIRKMKCSRQSPCLSCRMRGDECVWVGTPPNGNADEDELERSQNEVNRLKKLVDLLLARLEEQDEAEQQMQYSHHIAQQHQAASAAQEPVASTSSSSHYAARPTAASPPESDHYDQRDAPTNGHAHSDAAQIHHHDPPRRGSGGTDIPITPVHGPGARDAAYSHPAYSSSSLYTSGLVTGPGGHAMFPGAAPSSSSSMTRPGAAYPPPGHAPPYAGRYAAPSAAAGDDSSPASEWR